MLVIIMTALIRCHRMFTVSVHKYISSLGSAQRRYSSLSRMIHIYILNIFSYEQREEEKNGKT